MTKFIITDYRGTLVENCETEIEACIKAGRLSALSNVRPGSSTYCVARVEHVAKFFDGERRDDPVGYVRLDERMERACAPMTIFDMLVTEGSRQDASVSRRSMRKCLEKEAEESLMHNIEAGAVETCIADLQAALACLAATEHSSLKGPPS